jgi:hypothetical protein
MNEPRLTPIDLAINVATIFESLEVQYALGGSVAASLFGEPRTTIDIDFATRIELPQFEALLATAGAEFYVPEHHARKAIEAAGSFNLIHHQSGLKVDVFVLGDGLLDIRQIERHVRHVVALNPITEMWITAPDDLILRKLTWFREGGEVSDRQWRDIARLLEAQQQFLDFSDMRVVASELGLDELLSRAIDDAQRN